MEIERALTRCVSDRRRARAAEGLAAFGIATAKLGASGIRHPRDHTPWPALLGRLLHAAARLLRPRT
jgi:hypothetical protein